MPDRTCAIEGCVRPWRRREWCAAHYQRWQTYGSPLGGGPMRRVRGTAPTARPFGPEQPSGPRRRDSKYPPDDQLVALMREHHSYTKVAAACGVRRESLRDFLNARPQLKAAMAEYAWRPMNETEKQAAKARHRDYLRNHMRAKRAADPETHRELARVYMATHYGPEYRHRWNHYNRLRRRGIAPPNAESREYAAIIRRDPCVYCGAPCQEIDHIDPIANGGDGCWDNLAPTCADCNRQKHTKSVLHFMLARLRAS